MLKVYTKNITETHRNAFSYENLLGAQEQKRPFHWSYTQASWRMGLSFCVPVITAMIAVALWAFFLV